MFETSVGSAWFQHSKLEYGEPLSNFANHVETSVESAWLQRLKLEFDSNVAFNFNLRSDTTPGSSGGPRG